VESPVSFLSLFLASTSWACAHDMNTLALLQLMVVVSAALRIISKSKMTSCCFISGTNLGSKALVTLSAMKA